MRTALFQCGQVARALEGQVAREDKPRDSTVQTSTSVSVVDRLCQELIILRAHELAPELPVYSEELGALPPEIRDLFAHNRHRYAWIIDPLDGTDDYLAGRDTYAHMLGLLDQDAGRMASGMVYSPTSGRLCLGARGQGAFECVGLAGGLRPMFRPEPPRSVGDVKRLARRDYAAFQRTGFALAPAASRSAACEALRVVDGSLGALAMRGFHGHDTAVTSVIIEELGGAVVDECGRPVRYDIGMDRLPLVVASLVPQWAAELAAALPLAMA